MANVVACTDENFDAEVLQSEQPVLVDFSADWCGPCKIIEPSIEEIAVEYGDRLKVSRVDVDQAQQVAMRYGIMGVPTVMLFIQGEAVDRSVGAVPKAKLVEMIGKVLG